MDIQGPDRHALIGKLAGCPGLGKDLRTVEERCVRE